MAYLHRNHIESLSYRRSIHQVQSGPWYKVWTPSHACHEYSSGTCHRYFLPPLYKLKGENNALLLKQQAFIKYVAKYWELIYSRILYYMHIVCQNTINKLHMLFCLTDCKTFLLIDINKSRMLTRLLTSLRHISFFVKWSKYKYSWVALSHN